MASEAVSLSLSDDVPHQFIFHSVRYGTRNLDHLCPDRYKAVTLAVFVFNSGVLIGSSRCSQKDQWNRKLGRIIATGRALKALRTRQTIDRITRTDSPTIVALDRKAAMEIAREAAKEYLRTL